MKKTAYSIFILFLLSNTQVATMRANNSFSNESSNTSIQRRPALCRTESKGPITYEGFEVISRKECHELDMESTMPSSYKNNARKLAKNAKNNVKQLAKKVITVKNAKKTARFTWEVIKLTARATYWTSWSIYRGSLAFTRTVQGGYKGYMNQGMTIYVNGMKINVKPGDRVHVR